MSDVPHMEFSLHRKVKHTHTCMQHHPHDKDEWGRYGQLRLGKVSAAPGPPAFHHHPHTLMLTQILTAKKFKIFTPPAPKVQRGEGGNIYSELRQKTSVTSSLTLCPYYMTKCDTYSKSRHTNTKHVHMLVDTNSPPPPTPPAPMYPGALRIPCNSSNCTFWGFTILTSYVSATGLHWRDQLKRKGPTRPSCYDPPRCGHRSGCPSSRCDPGEAS